MNLLFDLGGVLFDIDYTLAQRAFEELGFQGFDQAYSKKVQNETFDAFEVGAIDEQRFIQQIREHGQLNATDDQIRDAWNAMLLGLRRSKVDFVKDLVDRGHRLFLLSNTNPIHLAALRKNYPLFAELEACFIEPFYSHIIHLRKPHAEAFLYVCKRMNCAPEEVIFIDDSPQHVQGALQVGIQALHLADGVSVEQLLEPYL